MEQATNHRLHPRHRGRIDAVIDYFPARITGAGRWWENFEARTVDVSESGVRIATTSPLKPGGRVRVIIPPERGEGPTIAIAGDIVWVNEPVLPWLGRYRAGVVFRPALQDGIAPLVERTESDGTKPESR